MDKIWVIQKKCVGCRTCEIACAVTRDSVVKTLVGGMEEEHRPQSRVTVRGSGRTAYPMQCRHCADAPCVKACRVGAMTQKEDGEVVLNPDKCVGCGQCVKACPNGAVSLLNGFRAAVKCDACIHRGSSACVESCPTGALFRGTKEEFVKYLIGVCPEAEGKSICSVCGRIREDADEISLCPVCGAEKEKFLVIER